MKAKHPFFYFTLRLLGYLFLTNFMGLSLLFTIGVLFSRYIGRAGDVLTQILCLCILLVFAYHCAWDEGFSDRNKIQYGRLKKNAWKGLEAGLLSSVPYLLMLAALLIAYFTQYYTVFRTVFILFNAAYSFLLMAFENRPIIFLAFILIYPAFSGIFYIMGLKDFWLSDKLIYKNRKRVKKR